MYPAAYESKAVARWRWTIRGQVQGVGFRPFIFRLAQRHHLGGFVRNEAGGVTIEAQGSAAQLKRFSRAIETQRPPLALLHSLDACPIGTVAGEQAFAIVASHDEATAQASAVAVTVDTAVCPDCLRELIEPGDRRRGYGLINCTNCGPRFSIIRRVPYDRPNTTMAGFTLCPPCRAEYDDPSDRRFHAQPTACHACGPRVSLVDVHGDPQHGDQIRRAARLLEEGRVVAIKGLGGFHLAARADSEAAVGRLRALKQRDHKPFALMCRSLADARGLVRLGASGARHMQSPQAPIVLAPRRSALQVAEAVAPESHRLGVMLPYTPIHHLLFAALDGRVRLLVMTSGNLMDEPLVIDNGEAIARLGGLCDAILWHDRPIERCVEDSVLIDMGDADPLPIRRARGYAPASLALPGDADASHPQGLCVGGELKNTVAVVSESRAVLGSHLGDLKHALAFEAFTRAIEDLCALFRIEPRWIAHDLHPMYLSTTHAVKLAARGRVPLIGVQHHHAHAASVMAEHGETGPVLAVVCDGVGYGPDGSIWGGELLLADLVGFRRLAHLRPITLPGGDAAARDTRRCALALLHQALGDAFDQHPAAVALVRDAGERSMLVEMIRRRAFSVASSGAGRVFDGVAALLGWADHNSFEARAAMRLEAAAAQATAPRCGDPLFRLSDDSPGQIDLAPLTLELIDRRAAGQTVGELAALFHEQFAQAWVAAVTHWVERTGTRTIALSGGVFCNQMLTERMTTLLERGGLRVLRHRVVPPNDGGLSLGQAAIAVARVRAGLVSFTREVSSCV